MEAKGPMANTQPISVPFSPLNFKYKGRKLKMIVFVAWNKKSNNFNENNEPFLCKAVHLLTY